MAPRGRWDARLFEEQIRALGERVRSRRTSYGWSQQDLSNRTAIDRANISRIEGGKKNITLEVLWRLANTLQVHCADLLDDRPADPPEVHHVSVPFEQQMIVCSTRAYQARALQRLSQQELADRTGIGRSTMSWIEDGTRNVTLETLSRLAAGLDVHWADLLDHRDPQPLQPGRSREQPAPSPAPPSPAGPRLGGVPEGANVTTGILRALFRQVGISHTDLCRGLGLDEGLVNARVRHLADSGWITVTEGSGSRFYALTADGRDTAAIVCRRRPTSEIPNRATGSHPLAIL